MVQTAQRTPSRADGSRSIAVASYNIRNGRNGGMESALRAMEALGIDLGILMETKVTGGIYTQFSSGYNVVASEAASAHQGGIALFWRPDKSYEIEDWRVRGPNVISFVIVTGSARYYAVGCYIPPNDLSTLTWIEQAWNECPKGHIPVIFGDLNINLRAPRDERDETIAEMVEDVMGLTDLSKHFRQRSRGTTRGRWTWRMRRGRRWISSQCDYFLGRATDRRRYRSVCLRTPNRHDSDHRAIITEIHAGSEKRMTAYRNRMAKFPIKLPRGPQEELCTLFEELRLDVQAPPKRDRPRNQWISTATWALIDKRAMLRQAGKLGQQEARLIGRQICAGLKKDRTQRAAVAAEKIEGHLAAGEPKEAWRTLKGWYSAASDRAPTASKLSLAAQTAERVALYGRVASSGDPLPIHVDKVDIPDSTPSDGELRAVVRGLRNGRAAGATGLKAEHIKGWLSDIVCEEKEESNVGLGDKWRLFVKLMEAIWEQGSVPEQMRWEIIVLLPKGGGDYRGIGLLEPFWKVIEKIMVARLASIKFHDGLHGGLPGRGTGTATIEAKLAQSLAWRDQCPLYQIYVDLKKAYDALDRERTLDILAAYGVGPRMLALQKHFWDTAKLVCRAGGNYGEPFSAERGVTQGGPLSSLMFNVCVDAVVREWLHQTLGEEVARDGIGELVAEQLVAFYVDDGLIASRDPVWLQESFDILIGLFERIGLFTNAAKTKVMVCIPGRIREGYTEEEYADYKSGTSTAEDRKRRRVNCEICGTSLAAGSYQSHLETQHDIFRSMVLQRDIRIERQPVIYRAIESIAVGKYFCPIPLCDGGASTKWNLRRHFLDRHPQDLVVIPSEGSVPLPKCERCGMQTERGALYGRHQRTRLCMEGWEKKMQHEAAEAARLALAQSFTAYGEQLERVEVFKYLGRLLAYDDNDTQAMRGNLKKARKSWAQVSRVLRAENASPKVCGVFYKATVQAVLLFGSETWNLSPLSLKSLEGFHIRAARRMAGMQPKRNPDGTWKYPNSGEVLKAVGLRTIDHYIGVRRETIAKFIVDRPLFRLCRDGGRKRGSTRRTFWWEQPLELDDAASQLGDDQDMGDD